MRGYTSDNFIGGIDIGGLFTACAMFKKWYQMELMGVFDFMIVNGRPTWDMWNEIMLDCFKLDNVQFSFDRS